MLPPAGAPSLGETCVTVGSDATYVYTRLDVVPPGVVTLTSTPPGTFAGMVTVICVSLLNVKHGADGQAFRSFEPTCTSVAPVKLVPVSTTLVPPDTVPEVGSRLVNVGGGVTYVYVRSFVVPAGVTTLTLTPPAAFGGIVAVICVAELNVKQGAPGHGPRSCDPTNTSVAPVNSVPVSTTLVPPGVYPDGGLRLVKLAPR